MEHFTTSDNRHVVGPRTGPLHNAWFFLADGEAIGEIEETERGYKGRLYGTGGREAYPRLTTTEASFRSAIEEHLIRKALIFMAKDRGVDVQPSDIDEVETGYPTISGMPAGEWIDAMTME
jgi:hypothetical protein